MLFILYCLIFYGFFSTVLLFPVSSSVNPFRIPTRFSTNQHSWDAYVISDAQSVRLFLAFFKNLSFLEPLFHCVLPCFVFCFLKKLFFSLLSPLSSSFAHHLLLFPCVTLSAYLSLWFQLIGFASAISPSAPTPNPNPSPSDTQSHI